MVHNINRRKTKTYRYYTCVGAIKRGRKTCGHPNLPACEIESAVIEQIRCIGADVGLRKEIVRQSEESVGVQRAEFDDVDRVWAALSIREQAELLQLLVAKVEFDQSDCTIAISFHASGIATLETLQTEAETV